MAEPMMYVVEYVAKQTVTHTFRQHVLASSQEEAEEAALNATEWENHFFREEDDAILGNPKITLCKVEEDEPEPIIPDDDEDADEGEEEDDD